MAASAVGGWMASAFISKLVDKVGSYAGGRYEYTRQGTKDKLRLLEKNLSSIKVVVLIAERLQAKNTNMGSWLQKIKDAAFQAENVLDLFDYRVLEAQAEDKGKVTSVACATAGPSSSSYSPTNITAASTMTSIGSTVRQSVPVLKCLFFSDEHSSQLMELVNTFDEIHKEMQIFLDLVKLEDRVPEKETQWRTTSSMIDALSFFGRRDEEKTLKNLLRWPDEQPGKPYDVISVVGIGGIGKTALVQKVYSDLRAAGHFSLTAWIHVSDKFDVKHLTREMVQSDNLSMCTNLISNSSLDQAQMILQDRLMGKRVLIVLDDVWNDMSTQWENLCKPLQLSGKGSKVIVTTRSRNVAAVNGGTEIIHLDGLEDDDYWMHFLQCSFGDADPSDFPELQAIGKKLVKKLAGSPLAAKTVGSSLKLKLDESYWMSVSESKLWQIKQKEDGIISSLRLSYEHLPDHLKQCFVYFALFPKSYSLRSDVLIQMWRAHGFIDKQTTDEDAHDYISDLLQLSFVQKVADQEDCYVVHDLLHEIAESVSNGEHFRIEDDRDVRIPMNVRHLYVTASNISTVLKNLQNFKELKNNLRSLIVCKAGESAFGEGIPWSSFNTFLEQILGELRSLRVLVLRNPEGILPDNVHHLVHLRYLNIHESGRFIQVPESLFKLYHLQGLNLQVHPQDKLVKKALQKGLSRLTQLRYLKGPKKIISGIELIGQLTSLQELEEYHVDSACSHSICQLAELNELRGQLTIRSLDSISCQKDSCKARLFSKENLRRLSLFWDRQEHGAANNVHDGVFEGLRPNASLRELLVSGYMGVRSPSWLCCQYMPVVHSIELLYCHHWATLPPLGSLPFLRTLKISHCTAVTKINAGFYGGAAAAFPSLEKLLFEGMDQWREWTGPECNTQVFPRLRCIRIKSCGRLMGPLPLPLFTRVKVLLSNTSSEKMTSWGPENAASVTSSPSVELSMDRMGLFFGCLQPSFLATVHNLNISFSYLLAFSRFQEECLKQLTSVKKLRFIGCAELTALPSNMAHLASLESLYIEKCPKLKSFPQNDLPDSLKKLSIIRCNRRFSELCCGINMSDRIHKVIVRDIDSTDPKRRKTSSL